MADDDEDDLLRGEPEDGHQKVTFVELFFDLVFVFAFTQISHTYLAHFSLRGVVETSILLLALWWVWVNTSWATNWLDPDKTPVRLALFVVMFAGLVLSTSVPQAFADRGLAFGASCAAMQLIRTGFVLWSLPADEPALVANFRRVLVWSSASAILWVGGGLAAPDLRLYAWGAAIAVEYAAPAARFRTPGLGASRVEDWGVDGGHMAERCALFIIIALGESFLITGWTFAALDLDVAKVIAFVFVFIASVAMWWIYFDQGVEAGLRKFERVDTPGILARSAYTYLHLPIAAGIIVLAVGDEVVLSHPLDPVEGLALFGIWGGPALFLFGVLLFKRVVRGRYQHSHLYGLAGFGLLLPFHGFLTSLSFYGIATAILVGVAALEAYSPRHGTFETDDSAEIDSET